MEHFHSYLEKSIQYNRANEGVGDWINGLIDSFKGKTGDSISPKEFKEKMEAFRQKKAKKPNSSSNENISLKQYFNRAILEETNEGKLADYIKKKYISLQDRLKRKKK